MATDKSNKKERVWHDPPGVGDPSQPVTLGAGVPQEVRVMMVSMHKNAKIREAISAISTAIIFTLGYVAATNFFPELTQTDIIMLFVAATIGIVIREAAIYYKIV